MNLSALFSNPKGMLSVTALADAPDARKLQLSGKFAALAEAKMEQASPSGEEDEAEESGNVLPDVGGTLLPVQPQVVEQLPVAVGTAPDEAQQPFPDVGKGDVVLRETDAPLHGVAATLPQVKPTKSVPQRSESVLEPDIVNASAFQAEVAFALEPQSEPQQAKTVLAAMPVEAVTNARLPELIPPQARAPEVVDAKPRQPNGIHSLAPEADPIGRAAEQTVRQERHAVILAAPLDMPSPETASQTVESRPISQQPQPHNFEVLVNRLAQARDYARPARAEMVLPHADFGAVTLRFEHQGKELLVSLGSSDPDFAPAAQAALTDRPIVPITEAQRAETQLARQEARSGSGNGFSNSSGGGSGQSQTSAQADSHRHDQSRGRQPSGGPSANGHAENPPQSRTQTQGQSHRRGRFA